VGKKGILGKGGGLLSNGGRSLLNSLFTVILIGLSIALSACSTYVFVTSDPSGAEVEINGQTMGQTPVDVALSDFDLNIYHLTLSKPGYRDKKVTLQKELKAAPFIGGFVLWPFWLWCYGPMDTYSYKLEPADNMRVTPGAEIARRDASSDEEDIEREVPNLGRENPDAVAVVIGISHCKNPDIPPVTYATAGANVVSEYFQKSFGVDRRRMIFAADQDAALSDFRKIFGEQLKNYIIPGKSDVYIYYQGHGVPDPETGEAYFVPYDCDPAYAKSTGYPLRDFYSNLGQLKARSITVILDACFSGASAGGMLLKNISPLYIEARNPVVAMNNAMIFASSTGEQVSCWFPEKKQSLFTYYFLKGLKGMADADSDGTITAGEMRDYLSANVPTEARYLNNREQTPTLMTKDPAMVLLKYR
jgi:PEGA domain/Caspase domain